MEVQHCDALLLRRKAVFHRAARGAPIDASCVARNFGPPFRVCSGHINVLFAVRIEVRRGWGKLRIPKQDGSPSEPEGFATSPPPQASVNLPIRVTKSGKPAQPRNRGKHHRRKEVRPAGVFEVVRPRSGGFFVEGILENQRRVNPVRKDELSRTTGCSEQSALNPTR